MRYLCETLASTEIRSLKLNPYSAQPMKGEMQPLVTDGPVKLEEEPVQEFRQTISHLKEFQKCTLDLSGKPIDINM